MMIIEIGGMTIEREVEERDDMMTGTETEVLRREEREEEDMVPQVLPIVIPTETGEEGN